MNGSPRSSGQPLTGLRIAVADDDDRMREFYEVVLAQLGHHVVASAENGHELVEACLLSDVDLVISDIRMPGMDGAQAARILAAQRDVPFVFVSAYHDDALTHTISQDFSYGHLVKPINEKDLAATIPDAMRRFRER